jgi:PKD repeat protein
MRTSIALVALAFLAGCTSKDKDSSSDDSKVPNNKPIAEAGEAIRQSADEAVALSGAASNDPDGDPITFHWSFDHLPEGSALSGMEAPFTANHTAEAVTTSFAADKVGTYVVKLTVTDDKGAESDPDYVIITVEDPTTVPVANAGADITTAVGTLVSLDGSTSYDPMGRTLTYAWTVVDKPTSSTVSTLTGADAANASFTPDLKGVYVLNLVVDNGISRSASDAVTVTAVGDDNAPVANAGSDQTEAEDCTTLTLDCSGSADPDGDTLQYLWEVQSKPSGSSVGNATFSDRTAARPTFYADVAGDYVLSCAVSDGSTWSTPDTVALTVGERRSNERPTITAGTDVTLSGGSAVCTESGYTYACDECAAVTTTLGSTATVTDADGDPLTILWTTTSSDATIADPTSLVTTVTLEDAEPTEPGDCEDTEYEFELTVTDCTGSTVTDRVILTVSCCGVEDTSAR